MHLVTCVHFRSNDKDGGYTIPSTVPENPMLHANIMALCLIERELLPIEVLHCENRNFRLFWLLWPWPWPDNLQIRTRPVVHRDTARANMNFLRQGFRKLSSDRQAYRHDQYYIDYHAASRVLKNNFSPKAKVFCVPACSIRILEYYRFATFFVMCDVNRLYTIKGGASS